MYTSERDRMDHFRQRWADENFNGSIVLPSSSPISSAGDHDLTAIAAQSPLNFKQPSKGVVYKNGQTSNRSWRESLGFATRSQEHLNEVAATRPYRFQPRNPDEETALPTIPDYDTDQPNPPTPDVNPSEWVTEVYTISYLIFFSLLGVLSRLGVEAITQYPNAPVTSRVLWANIGGCFVMGFMSQDQKLFKQPQGRERKELKKDEQTAEYTKWKKTIPLYIGITTGYCGSFTSFSTFIKDAFLELANAAGSPSRTLPFRPSTSIASRSGGFSFEALMAILIMQPALSIAALVVGAQFAIFTAPIIPNINRVLVQHFLNPLAVFLGIGCWLFASLVLSIIPPFNVIEWRTRALFPLMFAPVGTLFRYYLSKYLNPINKQFPWGTFASNVFGTIVLGMCWDLQHADLAGLDVQDVNACAVLVGVQEGFCGCLTTVSTWVAELTALSKKNAWTYGLSSVAAGLSSLIIIMGSMYWTVGFGSPACD